MPDQSAILQRSSSTTLVPAVDETLEIHNLETCETSDRPIQVRRKALTVLDAYTTPWVEIRDWALAVAHPLALLPFGAHEAHGPHLPLGTDTIVAAHAARLLAERLDCLLLPAVPYGDTWSTSGYPGSVGLAPNTVTSIAVDVARALGRFGIGLVIVNGDFGNRGPLAAAVRSLCEEGVDAIVLDYPGLDEAVAELRESEPAVAGMNHAEEIETSMVLAAAPETVRTERYVCEYPTLPPDFGLRPLRVDEVSASAVFGDPSTARADKGAKLFEAVLGASIPLIERFQLSRSAVRGSPERPESV